MTHVQTLRAAYDRRAAERDARPAPAWESEERDAFVARLGRAGARRLLDLGSGPGAHGAFFAGCGLDVVCVDVSEGMARRCRAKSLPAVVMDVAALGFARGSFDAVYAMNCLVHVPKDVVAGALAEIARVLAPRGLFYLGLYGGRDFEGIWERDHYEPKRFFSHFSDEGLRRLVSGAFEVVSFVRREHGWEGLHFQSIVLRSPATS